MNCRIFPPEEMPEAMLELPLSKSLCNRMLVINNIAGGDTSSYPALRNVGDDVRAIVDALESPHTHGETINIGAAGTAMRFLTALFASTPDTSVILDGSERMRRRPIGALVDALRRLGAQVEYVDEEGFPPLRIEGQRLKGGEVSIDATKSSQYASALLMVAPTMAEPLRLTLEGEIVSEAYLKMTIGLMERCGVDVDRNGNVYTVASGCYHSPDMNDIERDWSAASYWYELAAICAFDFTVAGLQEHSLQGDSALKRIFTCLGIETEFDQRGALLQPSPEMYSRLDLDCSDTPDLVQTLAVTCCMLGVPFRFSGVSTLRIKETDRIQALCTELDKLGIVLETEGDNVLAWEGRRHPMLRMPEIETYNDHRMAMAFAPIAVFLPGVIIKDIDVVSKSYPGYWQQMQALGFTLVDVDAPSEVEPLNEADE